VVLGLKMGFYLGPNIQPPWMNVRCHDRTFKPLCPNVQRSDIKLIFSVIGFRAYFSLGLELMVCIFSNFEVVEP
jgi:hypothetical protein